MTSAPRLRIGWVAALAAVCIGAGALMVSIARVEDSLARRGTEGV